MTAYPDLFAALAAPFDERDIRYLPKGGKQIAHVTARAVMNRLDSVIGPENWEDSYTPGEKSVLCTLSVKLPDGNRISKSDAGGFAGMADEGDDEKSGYSDAFKRAAVKLGVGRYLYENGVPTFAEHLFTGQAPTPPPAQRPTQPRQTAPAQRPATTTPQGNGRQARVGNWPVPGKSVYAFLKSIEELLGYEVLKGASKYGETKGYGYRTDGWDQDQINEVILDVIRYAKEQPGYSGQLDALSPPGQNNATGGNDALGKAKKDLVAVATKHLESIGEPCGIVHVGEFINGTLAPCSKDSSGHTGECLSSLRECQDITLIMNMINYVHELGRLVNSPPVGRMQTAAAADDDIPF